MRIVLRLRRPVNLFLAALPSVYGRQRQKISEMMQTSSSRTETALFFVGYAVIGGCPGTRGRAQPDARTPRAKGGAAQDNTSDALVCYYPGEILCDLIAQAGET
jgi:hypothetical protein